ncbi:hypothetical protein [Streptacidiphilus monticola]|uniref:Secreted protein n=1 Tax=Streptacidiphilus monticola TaxID=2161674 RepID=A0ABW1GCN5_9ACTN
MGMRVRRVAVAAAGAMLTAALPVGWSQTASAATPPVNVCTGGYGDGIEQSVPTARKPGVKLRQWIPVRNHQTVVLPQVYVSFQVLGNVERRAPLPVVWWRVKNGTWHRATLHWVWNSPNLPRESQWLSSNLEVGDLAPKATKWVEVDMSFPRHSIKGTYYQYFWVHSHACGSAALSWYLGAVEYWPWKGIPGKPA